MVRFITTANGLAGDALFAARGEHLVLLEAADNSAAIRSCTATWVTWGTVEGLDAMPLGDWLLLSMWGAKFDADVDPAMFDDEMVGLHRTAALWGVYAAPLS